MPIRRRSISPPGMILTGIALVISVLLLGIILSTPAEGELRRNTSAFQIQSVYAATPGEAGQAIFEQKCKSCHTIGGGRTVGPDLKGVTARRDRDWLIRFIVSPDQLIAQGDPIAKQLVQEYDGIPMPNMGLSDEEAKEALAHIEAQSGGGPSPPPQEQDTRKSTATPQGTLT